MSKGIGKYYKISEDGETLSRTRKFCPRCGPGTFMAEMYDRIVCGHCGFTEFKKRPPKKETAEEEEFIEEQEPKKITKEPKPATKKDAKPKKKRKNK